MEVVRVLVTTIGIVLSMSTGVAMSQVLTAEEAQAIGKEAAIYGLPVVENAINLYAETVDEDDDRYLAPLNHLKRDARLYTPEAEDVRTPNLDVVRARGWLDLRAQPVVLGLPEIEASRYDSVQLVDLYTYNFAYLGSRTTGNGAGHVLIAGPGWTGEAPEGVSQIIRSDTDFVRAIYATQVFDAADFESAKAILDEYTVQPLSTFLGLADPPGPKPPPPHEFDTDDLEGLDLLRALDMILQDCPVVPDEVELRVRFASIGIGNGVGFDANSKAAAWPHTIRDALTAGVTEGLAAVKAALPTVQGVGLYGTREELAGDYLKRAVGAQLGLYGNSRKETVQPLYVSDADGNPLDAQGSHYVLNLSGANLPPVDGFWSLTLYDRERENIIANPISRYRIDSRMLDTMKRDGGGGLSIAIQQQSPGPDMEPNWLPAPGGPFYMVLRLYWPKPEAADGTWKAPLLFAEAVVENSAPAPAGAEPTQEVVPLTASDAVQPELGRPTEWGEPTEVRVGIYVIDVDEVDSAEQSFSASVYYEAHWNSPFLRHKGPGPIHRNITEVWTPRLTILGQQQVWASFPPAVEIQPDGEVVFRQKIWGRFSQPLDLHDFPQDTQTLTLHLVGIGMLEQHVTMVPLELAAGRKSGIAASFSMPDFDVVSFDAEPTPYYPIPGQQGTAGFLMQIHVKRKFGYYVMKVLIPLCLIVIMSWLPRWISLSETSSNIGISTTSFLTLVAYLFAITVLLPRVSYITRLDRFILLSMLMVFGCLVQTVVNTILVRRGLVRVAVRIDLVSRIVYPLVLGVVLFASFDF